MSDFVTETLEKKVLEDENFSSEEKLIIIRALEKSSTNEDFGGAKKIDDFWYSNPEKNPMPNKPNWDYTKGPTC